MLSFKTGKVTLISLGATATIIGTSLAAGIYGFNSEINSQRYNEYLKNQNLIDTTYRTAQWSLAADQVELNEKANQYGLQINYNSRRANYPFFSGNDDTIQKIFGQDNHFEVETWTRMPASQLIVRVPTPAERTSRMLGGKFSAEVCDMASSPDSLSLWPKLTALFYAGIGAASASIGISILTFIWAIKLSNKNIGETSLTLAK